MGWILTGFSLIFVLDFLPLLLQKKTKIIIIYLLFFCIAFILALAEIKNWSMPYSLYSLETILKKIGISY